MTGFIQQPDIQEFLVALTVPEQAALGRTKVVSENLQLGKDFTKRFRRLVKSRGLEVEVAHVGKPMALPFVAIEATDRVAELVRTMPGVESVMRDHNLLESIA